MGIKDSWTRLYLVYLSYKCLPILETGMRVYIKILKFLVRDWHFKTV